MAIKGLAYTKTSWAFEERPVASAKLNTWDDRIEGALELVMFLLNHAWGGGNGVIRGASTDDLKVLAQSPASLSVEVQPGFAFVGKYPIKLALATQTPDVSAPTTLDRIDLVQLCLDTWSVSLKTGTEDAEPTAPDPDTDCLALANLYLRPGMTSLKDVDDSTNGYIIDDRQFL